MNPTGIRPESFQVQALSLVIGTKCIDLHHIQTQIKKEMVKHTIFVLIVMSKMILTLNLELRYPYHILIDWTPSLINDESLYILHIETYGTKSPKMIGRGERSVWEQIVVGSERHLGCSWCFQILKWIETKIRNVLNRHLNLGGNNNTQQYVRFEQQSKKYKVLTKKSCWQHL